MRRAPDTLTGLVCFLAATLFLSAQNQPAAEAGAIFLSVTVTDSKQNAAAGLKAEDFTVYEDGQAQQITSFSHEDVPVSLGILVDNSGSMRQKRLPVANGLAHLVEAGNPQDEAFIVNFSDDSFIDQDFTHDLKLVREALARVNARGGTALYDAVIASAGHMTKLAKYQKRVLVVVTDGEDNASRASLQQAIDSVQSMNGPAVYTIGIILDDPHAGRARKALESLSAQSGGKSYLIKNANDLEKIAQRISRELRSQYSITYKSANPQSSGGFRKITVTVGQKGLTPRTRAGYVAAPHSESKGR